MQRLSENSKAQETVDKYFNFPISKQDMANYLGITQETVSRQLADLKRKNVLSIKQKQVEYKLFKTLSVLLVNIMKQPYQKKYLLGNF